MVSSSHPPPPTISVNCSSTIITYAAKNQYTELNFSRGNENFLCLSGQGGPELSFSVFFFFGTLIQFTSMQYGPGTLKKMLKVKVASI